MSRALIAPENLALFARGGKATITIANPATGVHRTYKINAPKKVTPTSPLFVKVLSGPDNSSDYIYIGCLWRKGEGMTFATSKKSQVGSNSPAARGAKALARWITTGSVPEGIELWHEGKCCFCNRPLTVPESISRGYGPKCASDRGLPWVASKPQEAAQATSNDDPEWNDRMEEKAAVRAMEAAEAERVASPKSAA